MSTRVVPHRRRPLVRLTLLGGFELTYDGRRADLPLTAQRLLAFLALQEHAVQRIYVAGTLWLETSESRANGSLRSALWRIRQLDDRLVEVSMHDLRLASEVVVDAREAAHWALNVLHGAVPDESPDLGDDFLTGEFLPDWYEDWVLTERERLRELRVHALELLCVRLASSGRLAQAMEAALAAVSLDPLRESAHRLLIRVHLLEGNPALALRQYRLYRRQLQDRLGLEPSIQMTGLIEGVLAGRMR